MGHRKSRCLLVSKSDESESIHSQSSPSSGRVPSNSGRWKSIASWQFFLVVTVSRPEKDWRPVVDNERSPIPRNGSKRGPSPQSPPMKRSSGRTAAATSRTGTGESCVGPSVRSKRFDVSHTASFHITAVRRLQFVVAPVPRAIPNRSTATGSPDFVETHAKRCRCVSSCSFANQSVKKYRFPSGHDRSRIEHPADSRGLSGSRPIKRASRLTSKRFFNTHVLLSGDWTRILSGIRPFNPGHVTSSR